MWGETIFIGFIFLLGWAIRGEALPYKTKYNCPKCRRGKSKNDIILGKEVLARKVSEHWNSYPEDFDISITLKEKGREAELVN